MKIEEILEQIGKAYHLGYEKCVVNTEDLCILKGHILRIQKTNNTLRGHNLQLLIEQNIQRPTIPKLDELV